ncbi:hypothetical protein SAMN04487905_10878 [Actinopolyspora xinjiangensis]|uniref:Uncharacterized protein n=1 Tax=Actinopolyspora xinjiangensis TaxID=405564 RepID=A0A1H0V8E8_9ACTN|nr:LxmA leader domain family RiPP [Actinopolyspora xinjiangensis]SDP74653.1 hypothetical protein SAMN04487905_10878 [Actinopolyspora xinjiangensis]
MSTQDLIAGYAAYTNAAELHAGEDEAPAVTPTATSSVPCSLVSAASVQNTFEHGC